MTQPTSCPNAIWSSQSSIWIKWACAVVCSATILIGVNGHAAESTSEQTPSFTPEPLGKVLKLPKTYPSHWIVALDSSFFHMLEGQVLILDPLATTVAGQYKGMYTASFMAAIEQSSKRQEHYVAETFFSRGGRGGDRTDVVAIYDPATLSVIAEIELPPKRAGAMPKRIAIGLTNDQNFLLIYNFTPAQSVSVVNLETRTFAGEIQTPGCAFVIPTGKRGFSSLCANGSFLSVELDRTGKAGNTHRSDAVFDPNNDPVFEAYGQSGKTGYFPTFSGNILPVKLSDKAAGPGTAWSLVTDEERAQGWRPGGNLPIVNDNQGRLHILMHPDGKDGTHKNGGSEIWVFNAKTKKRTQRYALKNWAISLGMTGGAGKQYLVAVNAELGVDIYDAESGKHLNTIAAAMATPFRVDGVN